MAANRFEGSEIGCDYHCKVTGLSCSGPHLGCSSQSAWWLADNRSQSVSRQAFSDRTNAMAQHSFKSFMYFSCSTDSIELTNARKNEESKVTKALRRFLMSKWIIGTLKSSLKLLERPVRNHLCLEGFFCPPSHLLLIRAVTGVIFGARLLGRLISSASSFLA